VELGARAASGRCRFVAVLPFWAGAVEDDVCATHLRFCIKPARALRRSSARLSCRFSRPRPRSGWRLKAAARSAAATRRI
jgi:hypothetical protein